MAKQPPEDKPEKRIDLRVVSDPVSEVTENLGYEDEEIIVRRIDKRLAAREWDLPWVRRIVGFAVIAGAFWYGWQMLNRRSEELLKLLPPKTATQVVESAESKASTEAKGAVISTGPEPIAGAPLDVATLETIGECTKGVNAFRTLDLSPSKSTGLALTLESVFKPVLHASPESVRHIVNLQNIRIRTGNGEELRLHAAPKTQSGQLHLKLFRVAADGLPESIPFPDELRDLEDAKLSDDAVRRFLELAEEPGRAIEVERHESWSYPEKAGAQLMWSDDRIFDLQVFMRDRFLACSRGMKAGAPHIACRCVVRGSESGS